MKEFSIDPFGTFSKAISGAVALNFGQSGGINCDPSCALLGSACYAEKLERFRPSLRANLSRKESNQEDLLLSILQQPLRLRIAPWVRFSAFGSVPMNPEPQSLWRALAAVIPREDTHFPVESLRKFHTYSSLGFGDVLRLSMQMANPRDVSRQIKLGVPISVVADDLDDRAPGWTKRNKERARILARTLRKENPDKKIRACPAVMGSAKCGACKLCVGPQYGGADAVIYPGHP